MSDERRVQVGSRVQIRDGDEQLVFSIVRPEEADAAIGWISADCPIGRALLGRVVGEHVRVHTPSGVHTVIVLGAS